MAITGIPGWVDKLKNASAIDSTIQAYENVPLVYRCVNIRADAISSVAYSLYKNDEKIDWPFKQELNDLIKETEKSLLVNGAAYWLKLYNGRVLYGFQLLSSSSVTVHFDHTKVVDGNLSNAVTFSQSVNGKTYGPWTTKEVVYFRESSLTDEIGPGLAPTSVALSSAQLSHYLERFISAFFEGGAQPITLVNLPESMEETEFRRFKTEWQARFTSVLNSFKTAFVRSPEIKVTTITPPINTMLLPELHSRVITEVSMTFGVPKTMIEASAANYATADSDRQSFWRETIIPRLNMYQQVLNKQLFNELGFQFYFNPETLDVMQIDEAARSSSLLQLVQAGVPLHGALDILGYDYDESMLQVSVPEASVPVIEQQPNLVPQEQQQENESIRNIELTLLGSKLKRRIKSGKKLQCSFSGTALSSYDVKSIIAHLDSSATTLDVDNVINSFKAVEDLTESEKKLYNQILKSMKEKGVEWAKQILKDLPVTPSLEEVLTPIFRVELQKTALNRIDNLSTTTGIGTDPAESGIIVQDWLAEYTPKLISELDATTAKIITNAIEAYRVTPSMTLEDLQALISPAVSEARAASIAVTEITRANSQATIEYQNYLAERGIDMVRVWNTNFDDLVCNECGPLNNKYEDEWNSITAGTYPDGPPAHPRCRCDTTLTLRKK